MQAQAHLEVFGELSLAHIRGGHVVGERYSGPRVPSAIQKDPWLAHLLKMSMPDPWARKAHELIYKRPMNLVTTAGVNYLADAFAGTGNPTNFNNHAFGTGKESDTTHTLSGGSITNATPQVVTTPSAHGLTSNDLVTIAGVTTDTSANGDWQITVNSPTTFTLIGSTAGGAATVSSATYQRLNGAGDTAMVTDSGVARVAGTQTWPGSVNQYKTIATMNFSSSLAIVEWGLFSASTSGTLWDRRWFNTAQAPQSTASAALTAAPINVQNGDSIQATYTLTINPGGN